MSKKSKKIKKSSLIKFNNDYKKVDINQSPDDSKIEIQSEKKGDNKLEKIFSKKQIIKDSIFGLVMGINSIPYGSSSSLIAYQMNGYNLIVDKVCNVFSPKSFKEFWWNLLKILPFLFGFLISTIIMFTITSALNFAGYELVIIFLFIGINFVGMLTSLFFKKNRPTSLLGRSNHIDKKTKINNWILFSFIFLLIISLGLVAKLAWNSDFPSGHINFQQYELVSNNNIISDVIKQNTIQTTYALQILFSGLLCGITTFIPGLSGSCMLATLGTNSLINTAVRYAFGGYSVDPMIDISSNWAWSTIVITFIGLILGLVVSSFFTKWLLNKNSDIFKTISFGMSSSLFIATLVSLISYDYQIINMNTLLLGLSIGMLVLPIISSSLILGIYGKQKNLSFSWMWSKDAQ